MNFAIAVGVLIEKPTGRKINGQLYYFFRIGVLSETDGKSSYILCRSTGRVGFSLYSKCKEGSPVIVRGAIAYNRENRTNFIDVSYCELLFNSFNKDVQMGIKEFLEIYKPQNTLQEVKKLMKEQEAERRKKEMEEQCSDTESMSDM